MPKEKTTDRNSAGEGEAAAHCAVRLCSPPHPFILSFSSSSLTLHSLPGLLPSMR